MYGLWTLHTAAKQPETQPAEMGKARSKSHFVLASSKGIKQVLLAQAANLRLSLYAGMEFMLMLNGRGAELKCP